MTTKNPMHSSILNRTEWGRIGNEWDFNRKWIELNDRTPGTNPRDRGRWTRAFLVSGIDFVWEKGASPRTQKFLSFNFGRFCRDSKSATLFFFRPPFLLHCKRFWSVLPLTFLNESDSRMDHSSPVREAAGSSDSRTWSSGFLMPSVVLLLLAAANIACDAHPTKYPHVDALRKDPRTKYPADDEVPAIMSWHGR